MEIPWPRLAEIAQGLAVVVLVVLAAFTVIRQFTRIFTGRRACDIDQCASCPFGEGCHDKEIPHHHD